MPRFLKFFIISADKSSWRNTLGIFIPAAFSSRAITLILGNDRLKVSSASPLLKISSGVPVKAISPLFITIVLSAKRASSIKWVMSIMVIPCSSFSFLTTSITSRLPLGSSIAVDSSRINTSGFIASTPATAILCFCPPESLVGVECR